MRKGTNPPRNHTERQAQRFAYNAFHRPPQEFNYWARLLRIAQAKIEEKRWDRTYRNFKKWKDSQP